MAAIASFHNEVMSGMKYMIEVMEPKSLRQTMKEWAKSLWELYKQD